MRGRLESTPLHLVILWCALVVAAATTLSGQASQLVQNGSFESDYAGWTRSGDQAIATGDASHPASDGVKAVVLNPADSATSAVLSQTLATIPGERYGLSFNVGRSGGVINGRIRVLVQGTAVVLDQILEFGAPGTGPFYIPQHISFIANSASTTLRFEDRSISRLLADSLLDDVRVTTESADAPLVTGQPQRTAVAIGGSATFSVAASGPGVLAYQWRFNGVTIPGATASSYTVTGANGAKAGNYDVIVTNAAGSVTSSSATLTVVPSAIVLNGSFEYGTAAWTLNDVFLVYTTLNPAYRFSDGVQLMHFNYGQHPSGGTISQRIQTTPGQEYVLAFDAGAFSMVNKKEMRMRVTLQGDSLLLLQNVSVFAPGNGTTYVPQAFTFVADSPTTTLTFEDISATTQNVDLVLDNVRVTVPGETPIITADPQSAAVPQGENVSFTVTATGQQPLSYQWRFNGAPIGGAVGSSYQIVNAQPGHAGNYDVVVSNAAGSTTSAVATLTVHGPPTITAQPQSVTVLVGSSASFSVTATGDGPLSYQWRKNGVAIGGATASSYAIASAQTGDAGNYDVVVSNAGGSVTSAAAALTVTLPAGPFTNGSFESDYAGWTATGNQRVETAGSFYAATDGVKAVAFNGGQKPPDGMLSRSFATTVGQAYTLAFDVGAVSLSNTRQQQLQVTVQGTTQLLSQSVTVAAPGNGTRYVARSFTFVADSPTTTLTFRDTSATTSNVDLMLDNVRVTVQPTTPAPTITAQPQSVTVAVGASASFSVTATGDGPLSYQWRKNGAAIGGATAASYTIASAQTGDAGNYDVVVSNAGGSVTSAVATLTVMQTIGPFTNGSFESGYAGWTATGNQRVETAGSFYRATDGVKAVAFNGGQLTPNGVLSQGFATSAGQAYTLMFDVGAVSLANTRQQQMQVTVQGATQLLSQSVTVAAPGNGTRYVAQSFAFVADSPTTTLTFRDTSATTSSVDLMLDNVRVAESAAAGTLTNGSFEDDYTGWAATGHQGLALSSSGHPASNGSKLVVLNANNLLADAVLSQTFATIPGQRYGLALDLGTVAAMADQRVRVKLQGSGVLLDEVVVFAAPGVGPFYVPQHRSFVADGTSTTLTLTDVSSTYYVVDTLLDNIRIAPENGQAPLITIDPQRTAAPVGGTATFSVVAAGTGLSYQWQFASNNIAGATSSSYTVANVSSNDAGNYSVIVTNAFGSVRSSAATLTVLPGGILLNGSFEYGSAAWTFSNTSVAVSTNTNYGVTDGVQLVHFNFAQRTPNGVLSQSFATTPGQTYALAFDVGAFSLANTSEQRMRVTVQGGSAMLLSETISVFASGVGGSYTPQLFVFTSDSMVTTLSFQDVSPTTTNVDLLLDNVRITAGTP